MARSLAPFDRRLCLAIDMEGYGSHVSARHTQIQADLITLTEQAATLAGLNHSRWTIQHSGDGQFAVLPRDEHDAAVVDDFVRTLHNELRYLNEVRQPSWRIRLRVAIHFGPADPAPAGFAGSAPVTVGRLLDSHPLRLALRAEPEAHLAVVLSRQLFEDTVQAGRTTLRSEDFVPVQIRNKEFDDTAWLRIPGVPVDRLRHVAPNAERLGSRDAERHDDAPGGEDAGLATRNEASGTDHDKSGAGQVAGSDNRTIHQGGRDITVNRVGGGSGHTYVSNSHFHDAVEMHHGVIGMQFGATTGTGTDD